LLRRCNVDVVVVVVVVFVVVGEIRRVDKLTQSPGTKLVCTAVYGWYVGMGHVIS